MGHTAAYSIYRDDSAPMRRMAPLCDEKNIKRSRGRERGPLPQYPFIIVKKLRLCVCVLNRRMKRASDAIIISSQE